MCLRCLILPNKKIKKNRRFMALLYNLVSLDKWGCVEDVRRALVVGHVWFYSEPFILCKRLWFTTTTVKMFHNGLSLHESTGSYLHPASPQVMAAGKSINIIKVSGAGDDVPVRKWLRLFDMKNFNRRRTSR